MKKTKIEKVDALKLMRSLDFFQPFNEPELEMLLSMSEIDRYDTGEEIIREGDKDYAFYVLLKGSVTVSKKFGSAHICKQINELSRGDCFGEMAVVTGKPRSANVTAREETFAFKLSPDILTAPTKDVKLMAVQLKIYQDFSRGLALKLEKHSDIIGLLL